ncbi:lasso peptide biosynthesis B2 protein [Azospirillum halopraeferens]|uniref:lasso peptide biosynthesis B2 protein n=1 Tax=Azospirillum halopraeferens TaxID=34010 RepID=UPI000427062E|nr:lasso peptide biosynthesis B2 protein [Azospirillum halopraeferens]
MIAFALRIETALALVLALALVFAMPLRRAQALFGRFSAPDDAPFAAADADAAAAARARGVARRVVAVAARLPWHSTCLVRAVAGALLLARRGIRGARIRFGVRKEQGRLEAHAWLLLGTEVLLGGEGAGAYTPLADLGRVGNGRPAGGTPG